MLQRSPNLDESLPCTMKGTLPDSVGAPYTMEGTPCSGGDIYPSLRKAALPPAL